MRSMLMRRSGATPRNLGKGNFLIEIQLAFRGDGQAAHDSHVGMTEAASNAPSAALTICHCVGVCSSLENTRPVQHHIQ